MWRALGLAFFSAACLFEVGSVQAQSPSPNGYNCAALDSAELEFTACTKTLLNQQSLLNLSNAIRNIILGRFDAGPDQAVPAGLELEPGSQAQDRLTTTGEITIIPTADEAAAASATMWNFWVDGKYSWLDETAAVSNMDGSLVNLIAGADYRISDRMVIGLLGSFESSDLDDAGGLSQKTEGWGGGIYMGLSVTENIVLSANVLGMFLETDVNGVANIFESDRLQAATALTGYWYSGTWRYSPALGLSWSKEWQEANIALNDQTIETLVISPAMQIGNTISIGGANTVEPWIGAQFDGVAINKVVDSGLGTVISDPYSDLRLQGGLNFAFGGSAQLALSAEYSGLLYNKSDSFTAGANFAFQF